MRGACSGCAQRSRLRGAAVARTTAAAAPLVVAVVSATGANLVVGIVTDTMASSGSFADAREVRGAAAGAARRPERPQEVAVVHPVVPQIGRRGESAASLLVGDDALRLAEVFVTVFRAIEGPERPEEVGGASSRRAECSQEMA